MPATLPPYRMDKLFVIDDAEEELEEQEQEEHDEEEQQGRMGVKDIDGCSLCRCRAGAEVQSRCRAGAKLVQSWCRAGAKLVQVQVQDAGSARRSRSSRSMEEQESNCVQRCRCAGAGAELRICWC